MDGLTIGVRYLTGYAVATDPTDRNRAEWPPHPARVFMAMAAAHFETGGDREEADALRWLASLPAPDLLATEADERTAATAFVPVNDKPAGKGLLQSGLPRVKQPRTFPRVRPRDDACFLVWPEESADERQEALKQVCSKVTRIGHSSSPVQMWVADQAPEPGEAVRWQPTEAHAEFHLRVPSAGLLDRLQADYERDQRPTIGIWSGYGRPSGTSEANISGSIWNPQVVIRRLVPQESHHRRLDLVSTLQVCRGLHQAVVSQAGEPVPEFISGHQTDGRPSEQPHLACLPLAFVGAEHATGQLMGVAVALPTGLNRQERMAALAAVGLVERQGLTLGALGRWGLSEDDAARNLRPGVWTGGRHGSVCWATVTPIAFDRHAKSTDRADRERELADIIAVACQRIGLPSPRDVVITPVSPHLGVPAAHEFPKMRRKDGTRRRHAHAILLFDAPVRGPVAVGAGRYRGYGFCRPLSAAEVVQ